MKWFRFYSEVVNDPKVQRLPGDLFKFWVNLLCMANNADDRGNLPASADDIAWALRLDPDACKANLHTLQGQGLLDWQDDNKCYQPHNWEERQRPSDDGAERLRNWRQKKRVEHETPTKTDVTLHETLHVQKSNAVDKNRLREEEIREEDVCGAVAPRAQLAAAFWEAYPTRNGKKLNKAQAMDGLKHIRDQDWPALMVAVSNYAESGQGPMDAFRFLQADRWREWLQPAATKFGRRPSKAAESAAFLTEVIKAAEGRQNGRRDDRTGDDGGEIPKYLDIGKWPTG